MAGDGKRSAFFFEEFLRGSLTVWLARRLIFAAEEKN
jgi:hypothetical protein